MNTTGHFPAHRSRPIFFVAWIPQSSVEQTYLSGALVTFPSSLADALSISAVCASIASQSSVNRSNLSVFNPGNRLSSGLRKPWLSIENPTLSAAEPVSPNVMASFALLPARWRESMFQRSGSSMARSNQAAARQECARALMRRGMFGSEDVREVHRSRAESRFSGAPYPVHSLVPLSASNGSTGTRITTL